MQVQAWIRLGRELRGGMRNIVIGEEDRDSLTSIAHCVGPTTIVASAADPLETGTTSLLTKKLNIPI
jgi:hypothetical protein